MSVKCLAPRTMAELRQALGELPPSGRILGGGTDLIMHLDKGTCTPEALLYVGHIPELCGIEQVEGAVEIGAAVVMRQMAESPLLRGALGAIADAARDVGSVQIRNNGTIGGNVAGASPAGDLTPTLFLLHADTVIATPAGERREPIERVVVGPGRTSLAYREAIIRFIVPLPASQTRRSAFVKLGTRKAVTISRIGMAVSLDWDASGVITAADVVAGAISLTPVHVEAAEKYLIGKKLSAEVSETVGQYLSDLILKITPEMFDRDYKIGAARGVVEDVFARFS